jgi:hypothetical protein
VLLVAALRGDYHLTEIAGADLLMSIAPGPQEWFVTKEYPREERIDVPVAEDVIERLVDDAGIRAGLRAGRHETF